MVIARHHGRASLRERIGKLSRAKLDLVLFGIDVVLDR
jgi:hypothetical protein